MSDIMIREMINEDCYKVAEIHLNALSDDFLPSLGINFLHRGYYQTSINNPYGKVIVAIRDDHIVGFVNVMADPEAYIPYVIRKSWLLLISALLKLFIQYPLRFIEGIAISRTKRPVQSGVGEIAFIAVEPASQRQGIGFKLIDAANKYFATLGVRRACTKTLDSNTHVFSMYKRIGAHVVGNVAILKKKYTYLEWRI